MYKSSIFIEIYTKYKEFINSHFEYISNYDIQNEISNLKIKYRLDSFDYPYNIEYKLKNIVEEEIKNMAYYNIKKKGISQDEDNEIGYKEQMGEIVASSIFVDIIKQMYLEKRLLKKEFLLHINILETLWAHLGNGFFFDIKNTDWNRLFEYSIDLYYVNPFLHSIIRDELNVLIKATKYLKKQGIIFEIIEGKIILTDESHYLIHSKLEKMIESIGGLNTLLEIFNREIEPRYNPKLDRYLIHRNKSTMGETSGIVRVPYNYLINICGKFWGYGLKVLTAKGIDDIYKEIMQLSSYYLIALGLQGSSIFEDMMVDYKNIPEYISNNIIFENLYIPVQYNPNFVLEVLDNLYRPLFNKTKYKEFTFDEYYKVTSTILKNYKHCSIITLRELISKTRIKRTVLSKILPQISQFKDNINNDFIQMLTPTNLFSKPLVLLDKDVYFLVSPYFCGYSFLTVMHDILKREGVPALNRELGKTLEGYVKKKLEDKNFKYHSGHYSITDLNTKGECDIVLETNDKIIFLEVKKRALPVSFEVGDDVDVLNSLGEGMLHAQKQILNHRVFLQKHGYIKIHEEQNELSPYTVLRWDNRRIISISMCLPEYGFLTNKPISSVFLESLLFATYHAKDPNQEHKLNKVNKLREQIVDLVVELREEDRKEARTVFFDTLFRSLQQFLYALQLSNNIDELIDYLTEEIHVVYGSLDFYTTLL
ncbi:hypothetical protein [Tissierella sp. Yu-01]|uniref:hypothetical protein n=1 Tax=Tissierella sp. Yu-01 TaxID=3035694 RepID=UPI00240D7B1E|nr:hypothetical protein [Tissierella sp. Yu-01]WFA08555.1 hypothetical protein P3962_12615 [Tissierella sp. Yu-01]